MVDCNLHAHLRQVTISAENLDAWNLPPIGALAVDVDAMDGFYIYSADARGYVNGSYKGTIKVFGPAVVKRVMLMKTSSSMNLALDFDWNVTKLAYDGMQSGDVVVLYGASTGYVAMSDVDNDVKTNPGQCRSMRQYGLAQMEIIPGISFGTIT
jgi:hypothetical protein